MTMPKNPQPIERLARVIEGIDYRQDTPLEIASRVTAAGWTAPEDIDNPHLHGTYAGYQRHRRHGELVCTSCRAARAEWEKGRRAARAQAQDRAALTEDEMKSLHLGDRADLPAYVEQLIADRLLRYT